MQHPSVVSRISSKERRRAESSLWAAACMLVMSALLAACGADRSATTSELDRPTNAHVKYDSHSLLIGGKRIVLNLAEVEYFRMPSPRQWPEVLAIAKADGFNGIDTYVPWNYHEPTAGGFRFSGRYDIGRFLADAARAGLYVQVRIGPNETGGIDGGGTPSWVLGHAGYLRTDDPNYTQLWTKWYDAVVPQLRGYQIGGSKHGSLILVMGENEYTGAGSGAARYAANLYHTLRRDGVTVPITANDYTDRPSLPLEHRADIYGFDQYPLPCSVPCTPSSFGAAWGTETFSSTKATAVAIDGDESYFRSHGVSGTPLFASETSGGQWPSQFGYGKQTVTSLQQYLAGYTTVAYFSLLGQGVTMIQPWIAFGGDSWGYLPSSEFATTYDWLSPIAPTGGSAPRFAEARLVGEQMRADARSLADTVLDASDVRASNPAILYRVRRSQVDGALHIFLRNSAAGAARSTAMVIDGTKTPQVTVPGHSASYLLAEANVSGWHLRWSTAQVLLATHDELVLFGDPGQQYAAVVDGRRIEFTVGRGRPRIIKFSGGRVVIVVSRQDAARTWVKGKEILIGPALVTPAGVETKQATLETAISGPNELRRQLAGPPPASSLRLPSLKTGWRFEAESPERLPGYDDRTWLTTSQRTTTVTDVQPLTEPVLYADNYGMSTGFVWYRGTFAGRAAGVCIEGRTTYHVWLNGVSLGTVRSNAEWQSQNPFGTGPPVDEQIELRFPAGAVHSGANELSVLTDDEGHNMDVGAVSWAKTPRGLWSASIDRGRGVRCGHFLSGVPTAPGVVPKHGPRPSAVDGGISWKLRGGPLGDFPNSSGLLGETRGWYRPSFDDRNWTPVGLPDTGRLSGGEVGWYRTRFSLHLPACVRAGLSIGLPGRALTAELYLNGVNIGQPGRDLADSYVLPPGIVNPHGTNTLAIARWAVTGSDMPSPTLLVDSLARTCGFAE
jgi:hypothetical protein